ncbi:carboxylate--amine ligase [Halocatena halophila]|uniref:carboxylate--amine ligase n=1 Tax=Halocatena halophila TaxID=2814576 RepID=UPI002ED17D53
MTTRINGQMKDTTVERNAVLLPINHSGSSLSCLRSLHSHGVRTVAVSEHVTCPGLVSRFCDEQMVVPSPYEDLLAYKDALLAGARRPSVATIIPHREMDSYLLAKYHDEFAQHVTPLWPTFEQVQTVQDSLAMADAAQDAGVPTPNTWSFDAVPDWDRPLIVKPRYAFLTGGHVDSLDDDDCIGKMEPIYLERGERPTLADIQQRMHPAGVEISDHIPVVQERVDHTAREYGFRGLCDRGQTTLTCQKRQIRGTSYAGGASVYRKTMADEKIDEYSRQLLSHLDWHGLASVQYLYDPALDNYVFTEINPRVWASLEMDVCAGANFPVAHWQLATTGEQAIETGYTVDTGNHLLFGELQYLLSIVREEYPDIEPPSLQSAVIAVARSCVTDPHFDFVRLDDPRPLLTAIRNQLPVGSRDDTLVAGE